MKRIMIALGAIAIAASGSAMAQKMGGPKVGATRDQAIATAAKMFGRFDQNGDGSIDRAEATSMLQARASKTGKPFRPKAVDRIIGRNDGNADGKVTLDEMKAAAGASFDKADVNKNGTIDADETTANSADSSDQ